MAGVWVRSCLSRLGLVHGAPAWLQLYLCTVVLPSCRWLWAHTSASFCRSLQGMRLLRTDLSEKDLTVQRRGQLADTLASTIPVGVGEGGAAK